jgi:hypothetical protein
MAAIFGGEEPQRLSSMAPSMDCTDFGFLIIMIYQMVCARWYTLSSLISPQVGIVEMRV